jgi:acetolactate decarboxylase
MEKHLPRNYDLNAFTLISTTVAFTEGVLETPFCIGDLKKWGNFGFGATAGISNGVILLDNQVYSSGNIDDSSKLCLFHLAYLDDEDKHQYVVDHEKDINELRCYIDSFLRSKNILYAIRIDGQFDFVETSDFPKQTKPYPRLTPEMTDQSINRKKENLAGTLLCFWLPNFLKPINNGGGSLHIHFISQDRKFAGHIINCHLQSGTMAIHPIHNLNLRLPKNCHDFYVANLSQKRPEMLQRANEWIQEGIGGRSL